MTLFDQCARAAWEKNRELCADEVALEPWEDETEHLRDDWRATTRAILQTLADHSPSIRAQDEMRLVLSEADR